MLRRGDANDEGLEETQVEEVVYVWKKCESYAGRPTDDDDLFRQSAERSPFVLS